MHPNTISGHLCIVGLWLIFFFLTLYPIFSNEHIVILFEFEKEQCVLKKKIHVSCR